MGIKLSQVQQSQGNELLPITIPVGDEALHAVVRPAFYTYDVERTIKQLDAQLKAQQNGEDGGDPIVARSLVKLTLQLFASWDLENEDGAVYELTEDGLGSITVNTLMWVWQQAMAQMKAAQPVEA